MQQVRPLSPHADTASARRKPKPWIWIVALVAAGSVFLVPGQGELAPQAPLVGPDTLSAPVYSSPAANAFADFVAAVNRGDAAAVESLLADELPDIAGLGTVAYPNLTSDPKLWSEGKLAPANVVSFVDASSAPDGGVSVTGCTGFSDGPVVVVASCVFESARGFDAHIGVAQQSGMLFGFVVDGKVAGLVTRAVTSGLPA